MLDTEYRKLAGPMGHRYLNEMDARLLTLLSSSLDVISSREETKRAMWGDIKVSNNALDKQLSALRQALVDVGSGMKLVSVYGHGVKLGREDGEPGTPGTGEAA